MTATTTQQSEHTMVMWEYIAYQVWCLHYTSQNLLRLFVNLNTVYSAYCDNWELRLSEGKTEFEGRLEVCFNRRWGTVGSEGWSQANSQVFCNNYGYDATGNFIILLHILLKSYMACFLFIEVLTEGGSIPQSLSRPVHIRNVVCQRTALTLDKCSYDRYSGISNDVTDVIIVCQNGKFFPSMCMF